MRSTHAGDPTATGIFVAELYFNKIGQGNCI